MSFHPSSRQRHNYPALPPARPADLLRDLASLLRGHGLARLYTASCSLLGVLSVTGNLTVWTNGRHLHWHNGPVPATRRITTAADLDQAARDLASLARTRPSGQTRQAARKAMHDSHPPEYTRCHRPRLRAHSGAL